MGDARDNLGDDDDLSVVARELRRQLGDRVTGGSRQGPTFGVFVGERFGLVAVRGCGVQRTAAVCGPAGLCGRRSCFPATEWRWREKAAAALVEMFDRAEVGR